MIKESTIAKIVARYLKRGSLNLVSVSFLNNSEDLIFSILDKGHKEKAIEVSKP